MVKTSDAHQNGRSQKGLLITVGQSCFQIELNKAVKPFLKVKVK